MRVIMRPSRTKNIDNMIDQIEKHLSAVRRKYDWGVEEAHEVLAAKINIDFSIEYQPTEGWVIAINYCNEDAPYNIPIRSAIRHIQEYGVITQLDAAELSI